MHGADGLQLSQAELWACHFSAFKGSPNLYICDILLPQVGATSPPGTKVGPAGTEEHLCITTDFSSFPVGPPQRELFGTGTGHTHWFIPQRCQTHSAIKGCRASFLSRRKLHISHVCVERLSAKATSGITRPCATQVLCEAAPSSQP